MVAPGERILIGVSGGPDSMALLYLLHRLSPPLKLQLGVAHLNHCLRGVSADRDAEVVRQAAQNLGIPYHLGSANVMKVKKKLGLSLEDAAHRIRYAFFNKIMLADGYNKLALGHHMDDNAEQVLMALLRGAGPRGLSGIAPVREKRIIRPLINANRLQIEEFVRKEGIVSVTDASNDDLTFMRNRVRKRLIPLLATEYNPRITDHLNRLADVTRAEEKWLDQIVLAEFKKVRVAAPRGAIALSIDSLRLTPSALTRRLVRMALKNLTGTLRRITFSHIQSTMNLLAGGSGEKTCHLPDGIRVLRTNQQLVFQITEESTRITSNALEKKKSPPEAIIPYPLPQVFKNEEMGTSLRFFRHQPHKLPNWSAVRSHQAYFDVKKLHFPLRLRLPVPGDRFTPLGAGGSQKIKKYFIDHRIPRVIRAVTPVLADQQRIIWLVGQRMDEYAKVTENTYDVLCVEYFLLDI